MATGPAADIDYEDDSGRVADFHALRHTFIFPLRRERYAGQANLARAGVYPRNAQALARHSTIEPPSPEAAAAKPDDLSAEASRRRRMNVYTHVAMGDLHDNVESLPGLPGDGSARRDGTAVAAATVDAPAELAGPISSWRDLPVNVRSAIAALADA